MGSTRVGWGLVDSHSEQSFPSGVWYRILNVVSKLAVLSNALIIAFTSEFVPRLYYSFRHNSERSLVGYVNFTLSYFDTTHYAKEVDHT